MANINAASDVLRLVQEWDEITHRLWKGGYRETDFKRPAFQDYLGRLMSHFSSLATVAKQLRPRLADLGELPIEAKPTQQELMNYARDFDLIQLKKLLPQLSQAAEQRGIDSSAFINLGSALSAMLSENETIPLADAAWTSVERLKNRVAIEPSEPAPKQSKPRDNSPTEVEKENGRQVLAKMGTKNPSIEDFRVAMKIGNAKAGLILREITNPAR